MSSSSSEQGSSSSSEGNIFLDNIGLFRQYSLDADLIELYFNKGVSSEFVDLDASISDESSSSSSESFLVTVTLEGDEGIFGDPYEFPEDMEFYFYDEKVDGIDSPGMFRAEKVPGQNKVLIEFASSSSSGTEYEFQINIEHPKLTAIRTTFRFSEHRRYHHADSTTIRIKNSTARLQPDYTQSLLSWIGAFWSAYDAEDPSLVPALPRPPLNANSEFDPFAHARWKIRSSVAASAFTELAPGRGWRTVRGWNFLGVSGSVWDCITKPGEPGGLYSIYYDEETKEFSDWIEGSGSRPNQLEKSFDCRSFTAAAAYALKNQLASECEADVKYQKVGQDDNTHAILRVDLKGCADGSSDCGDCCSGSFLYEPQSGATFRSQDEYCKKNPQLCEDKSQWGDGEEIQDAGPETSFGTPDWEKDPAELQRIKDLICGCIASGDYHPASAEQMIKSKCASNAGFKNWFAENFAHEPGKATSPMTSMPKILSCERVVCEKGRLPAVTGPLCSQKAEEGEQGITPYQCETQCQEKWECYENAGTEGGDSDCLAAYSLGGIVGTYDEKEICLDVCSNDKACVQEWIIKYDCESQSWTRLGGGLSFKSCLARDRFQSSSGWESLDELGCNYRKFTLVQEASCEDETSCGRVMFDDPSAPSEVGSLPGEPPTGCCGSWCELDSELNQTGNCIQGTLAEWAVKDNQNQAGGFSSSPCTIEACQEKTKTLRLWDQYPEWGNNPFG